MPVHVDTKGQVHRNFGNLAILTTFDDDAIKKYYRVNLIEGTALPGFDLFHNAIGCLADQASGNINMVHLKQTRLDVTNAHAAGVHSNNLIVKTLKILFALGDKLRFKVAVAVTRRGKLDLVRVDNDCFFASTIAAVAAVIAFGVMLAVAEMVVHLSVKTAFNDQYCPINLRLL